MIKKNEEPGSNSHPPHLEEKKYLSKSRPKVLFKKEE